MRKAYVALLLAAPLGACATTSFAPPGVNPQLKAHVAGSAGCEDRVVPGNHTILPNVHGAMTLTDNYIFAYRCAERKLADGRQFFQVPSFFAAVAGLLGPTLGLSNTGILLTGAGAGIFNMGNSYYAPKAKAGIVGSASRALMCIKTEAVGISYFKTDQSKDPPKANPQELRQMLGVLQNEAARSAARASTDAVAEAQLAANLERQHAITMVLADAVLEQYSTAALGEVYIDAEEQYFGMVSGALFSVESILAERLRDTGTIDTAEMFAKLKELAKAHTDAENALKAAKGGAKPGIRTAATTPSLVKLENAVLQPKLQTCVLQARA